MLSALRKGFKNSKYYYSFVVDSNVRAIQGVGLWPLACCDCGFEFCWGHGCLCLVSVVCCQVDVFATSRSYTGCNRRNGPDFGRVFLMLNYTEKHQNTYIQSSVVTEI